MAGFSAPATNSRTASWEEEGAAIPMKWTRQLMTESINSVFKVMYKGIQGTGSFYECEGIDSYRFNRKRSLFITCNHVVETNSLQEILEFMKIIYPIIGSNTDDTLLELKKEHWLCCWTRKCYCLDATVIELSAEGERYLRGLNITFMQIADAKVGERVAILQIPEGHSKFAYGNINKIEESKVFYQIATAPGSSGAPVLNENCMAVAIHRAGDTTNALSGLSLAEQPELQRKASALRDILKAFFNEVETLYA